MVFSAGLGTGIKNNRNQVVQELLSPLKGLNKFEYPFQSGLILADALSGHTDEIIDMLTEKTGTYQFLVEEQEIMQPSKKPMCFLERKRLQMPLLF